MSILATGQCCVPYRCDQCIWLERPNKEEPVLNRCSKKKKPLFNFPTTPCWCPFKSSINLF